MIINYNGIYLDVMENGDIYKDNKKIKTRISPDGYEVFSIKINDEWTTARVHRLVALAFIKNDNVEDKIEVNHKDFDRLNNNVGNLEWMSHTENVRYSFKAGNYDGTRSGERNGRSVYTNEEVGEIRKLYDGGMKVMDIIKYLFPNLEYCERKNKWSRIKEICNRTTYKDII